MGFGLLRIVTHVKYHKKNGMSLAITTADRGQILIEADVSYSYKGYFYFKEPPYHPVGPT
jgi:hypothetical protein